MHRFVAPEHLDTLPPDAPKAIASRQDLRRVNYLMGNAKLLAEALRRPPSAPPANTSILRWVELGGGDGTLLLRLARQCASPSLKVAVTLVDRHDLVSSRTKSALEDINWSLKVVAAEVADWLEESAPAADVMLANLFLHHFDSPSLARLLQLVSRRTQFFVACEPHRSRASLMAARALGVIGCNAVTRHDATVSVRAGFQGQELSALWPGSTGWDLKESAAGLFSHLFSARSRG